MIDAKDVGYYSAEIRHLGYNANLDVDEKALCEIVADMLLDHAPLTREELERVLRGEGFANTIGNLWENKEWLLKFSDSGNLYANHDTIRCKLDIPLSAVTRAMLRKCRVIK